VKPQESLLLLSFWSHLALCTLIFVGCMLIAGLESPKKVPVEVLIPQIPFSFECPLFL
jgi:hypothetical protein